MQKFCQLDRGWILIILYNTFYSQIIWRDFHHCRVGEAGTTSSYVIQYPAPDNHRQEILEFVERVLIKESEKYADLAIFCSDGIAWSSKLILASASPFIKDVLSSVPNNDDTCLVLPHMTKVEFLTFQSALFSKDETHQTDMYSVIKGKSDSVYLLLIWCYRNWSNSGFLLGYLEKNCFIFGSKEGYTQYRFI